MSDLTREQIDELFERSKDDRAIIVGSEVRQLASMALRSLSLREQIVEEANQDAAALCEIAVSAAWRQFVMRATGICSARATGHRYAARFQCGGHTVDEKRRLADELDQVAAAIRALSAAPNNAPQQGDFAAAQKGGPDRASSDSGTQDLVEQIQMHWTNWQLGDPNYGAAYEALAKNLINAWPRLRDALKTAQEPNENAVAGESPDARDAERLRWFVMDDLSVDEIGGLDLHSLAADNAAESGRQEPNDDDYMRAIRIAVDAAMGSPTDE